jgi:hypothetical protein
LKYHLFSFLITLNFFLSIQTYSIYGINGNETNTTESIASGDQFETNELGDVQDVGVIEKYFDSIGNITSNNNFKDMILEGKTIFLNVLNIKPNSPINHSVLTCFIEGENKYLFEFNCDQIIVFGKNELNEESINSIKSNSTISSAKISTVVNEGIDKSISACRIIDNKANYTSSTLEIFDCRSIFIAYN